jgi:acyl-CoA thioesterase YciA
MMGEQAAEQGVGDREPRGTLSIRTLCMPADTNQNGDIFGGWLLG